MTGEEQPCAETPEFQRVLQAIRQLQAERSAYFAKLTRLEAAVDRVDWVRLQEVAAEGLSFDEFEALADLVDAFCTEFP
jgi:hypothetical protein